MRQSLGYANDISIYNALNQKKMTNKSLLSLFKRKGILYSDDTAKEKLAEYYSRMTHDYFDHKKIAEVLGVTPRKDKITLSEIMSDEGYVIEDNVIVDLLRTMKNEINSFGHQCNYSLSKDGEHKLDITYVEIDYNRPDFQQMITRHGEITVKSENNLLKIRSTQSNYINTVRNKIKEKILQLDETNTHLQANEISLEFIDSPEERSNFLIETINNVADYSLEEITQIHVFKNNDLLSLDGESLGESTVANISDAILKGSNVHMTSELRSLSSSGFYFVKISFQLKGKNDHKLYTIDVEFKEKSSCKEFSYIVKTVQEPRYDKDTQTFSSYKIPKAPTIMEQVHVVERLEESAKIALKKLTQKINRE